MKRKTTIALKTSHGPIKATINFDLTELTTVEQQQLLDVCVDDVVGALRSLPFIGNTPFRNISVS